MAELVSNKTWVFKKPPTGLPKAGTNTTIENRPLKLLPEPGGLVVRLLVVGLDPHQRDRMRGIGPEDYTPCYEPGDAISNFSNFEQGDLIQGILPIAEYALISKNTIDARAMASPVVWKLTNKYDLELKHYLGPLGLAGMTAWNSFYGLMKPTKGQIIWVNAASSSVGEVVVQLAKMEGMRVIASVSSDEKLKYVLNLGADSAVNYRREPVSDALKRLAPNGLDVVYENVGGDHFQAAIDNMKLFGLIISCGMVSQYNKPLDEQYGVTNLAEIFRRRIRIQGFIFWDENIFPDHIDSFNEIMPKLISEGKLQSKYTHYEGIEQADQAFLSMFTGRGFGKAVISMAET
ncbi:hypothetical protein F4677DRAFT_455049 [Hypoxylon crocopeplum]|nr:hypothetical protein F4677DRAFT_455049 [Hypoxylon crocopeplum]